MIHTLSIAFKKVNNVSNSCWKLLNFLKSFQTSDISYLHYTLFLCMSRSFAFVVVEKYIHLYELSAFDTVQEYIGNRQNRCLLVPI